MTGIVDGPTNVNIKKKCYERIQFCKKNRKKKPLKNTQNTSLNKVEAITLCSFNLKASFLCSLEASHIPSLPYYGIPIKTVYRAKFLRHIENTEETKEET